MDETKEEPREPRPGRHVRVLARILRRPSPRGEEKRPEG